jgi:hypothetical protein
MTMIDALRLGRVSNLPTVWTNGVAGAVLAAAAAGTMPPAGLPAAAPLGLLLLALSLFYTGGMYLNDAFDAAHDARARSSRPIPAGRVSATTVFVAGAAQLALALILLAALGTRPLIAGVALTTAIVIYDAWHKGNPFAPLLMGGCRALVYVAAATAFAPHLSAAVVVAAVMLACHVAGLSYAARQEGFGHLRSAWPLAVLALPLIWTTLIAAADTLALVMFAAYALAVAVAAALLQRRHAGDIGRAVPLLIAAISLFDAVVIAAAGLPALAGFAAAGFALTLALQRAIPGT